MAAAAAGRARDRLPGHLKGHFWIFGDSACYVDREFQSELVRGFFLNIYFLFDASGMYLISG